MRSRQRHQDTKIPQEFCTLPADPVNSVRYFANPGPQFEERLTKPGSTPKTRVKAVAFYLPQFHAFPENDAWWGTGFTEWRNVARAMPRYQGHYQPRIPRDLGFYDLNRTEVIEAQAELANAAGISAFCFYYYWFNGQRLMNKPLDHFTKLGITQEFCIMWANENWTRRWDGRANDVLISQNYQAEHEEAFLNDIATYLQHPRYLRVNGKPLFIIYRASEIPETQITLQRWRTRWREILGVTPLIYMAQSYDDRDPSLHICDGAIEFPPHKVSKDLQRQNELHPIFDPTFTGQVRAYHDVIKKSLGEEVPAYPLIKTVCPSWDNDARREGAGVSFQGSTPEVYAEWLNGAINYARKNPVENEPLVFINAWNEWAEAAYLEPDIHYGHAYLNATYKQLLVSATTKSTQPILLIGHDAHKNGAQMLLLALAKHFTQKLQITVHILLKGKGGLLNQYRDVAPTFLLDDIPATSLSHWLRKQGYRRALFNTVVTGDLLAAAKQADISCTGLIHELPTLINEGQYHAEVQAFCKYADHLIFASNLVKQGFDSFQHAIQGCVVIQPQGLYKRLQRIPGKRQELRGKLGIPSSGKLVINIGYGDQRKGFDLFVASALRLTRQYPDWHFCWIGKRTKPMSRWFKQAVKRPFKQRIHLLDFTDDVSAWYSAADCFYLSSREDPYPSVVLEAMSLGLPTVMYKKTTGFDGEVLQLIAQADIEETNSLDNALISTLSADSEMDKQHRIDTINQHYQFDNYATLVLNTLTSTSHIKTLENAV